MFYLFVKVRIYSIIIIISNNNLNVWLIKIFYQRKVYIYNSWINPFFTGPIKISKFLQTCGWLNSNLKVFFPELLVRLNVSAFDTFCRS